MIPYNSRRLPRFSRLFLMVLLTVSSFAQALECEWRYINQWNGGATAELHASNNTSSAITLGSFTAGFSAGVSIQQAWNAAITGSNPYTFTPYEWNADLQPGGSMYVGMQITLPAGEPAEDHIPVLGGECSTGSDPNEPLGSLGISTVEKALVGSTKNLMVSVSHPSTMPSRPSLNVAPYTTFSLSSSTGSSGSGSGYIMGYEYRVSYDNPGTYLWKTESSGLNLSAEKTVEVFSESARPSVNYSVPAAIYASQSFAFTLVGEDTESLASLTLTPPTDSEFILQTSDRQSDTLWTDVYTGALPEGVHEFFISAKDPDGFLDNKRVSVEVLAAEGGDSNTPPMVEITSAPNSTENETVVFRATITDTESNIVNATMVIYQMVDGERTNPVELVNRDYEGTGEENLAASWGSFMVGEMVIEVVATDAEGERSLDQVGFTVVEDAGGSIRIGTNTAVLAGDVTSVTVSASHPTRVPYSPSLSVEPESTISVSSSSSSGGGSGGYTTAKTFGVTYDYPGTYLLTATSAGIEAAELLVEVFPLSAIPSATIEVPEVIYANEEFILTALAEDGAGLAVISLTAPDGVELSLQSSDRATDTYWVDTYTASLPEGAYSFRLFVRDTDNFTHTITKIVTVEAQEEEPPEGVLWCDWFGYEVIICDDHSLTGFHWLNNASCVGYQTCGESRIFTQ